jgi:hypothetical protein
MIERRARRDFVEACNEAGASMGARARFRPQDVAVAQVEAEAGVAALVSVLEARRAGWRCRWNGADPATLARDAGPQ